MFFVQPWTRGAQAARVHAERDVGPAGEDARRRGSAGRGRCPRPPRPGPTGGHGHRWPAYAARRQARTGPKASVGRTLVPKAVKATEPISAVTLKNRLSCSTGRPVRCHGWIETRPPGADPTSADSRSRTSGRSRRTSASRKTRTSSPGSRVAAARSAPVAQAHALPVQPSGRGGAVTTSAPPSTATAAVRSDDSSSTTRQRSPGRSWGTTVARSDGSEASSSRAGTTTVTGGRRGGPEGRAGIGRGRHRSSQPQVHPTRNSAAEVSDGHPIRRTVARP